MRIVGSAVVLALLAAACAGDDRPDDPATAEACELFEQTITTFRAGQLDYAGLQDGIAAVDAAATDSEDESVRMLAARMAEVLDFRPADDFVDALRSFSRACER